MLSTRSYLGNERRYASKLVAEAPAAEFACLAVQVKEQWPRHVLGSLLRGTGKRVVTGNDPIEIRKVGAVKIIYPADVYWACRICWINGRYWGHLRSLNSALLEQHSNIFLLVKGSG